MLGIPFDFLIKLTKRNLPISSARIKKLGTSTHHSAKKLFSLGFTPQYSSTEGLKKMVEWYRSQQ
jgi:nucleoside-diphosphate-sugar epimerase